MSTPAMIPAEVAMQLGQRWLNQQNKMLRIPQLSAIERQMAKDTCVHIYNVGPWEHGPIYKGDVGQFVIPACPPDKKFVRGPVIDGIFSFYIRGDGKMERLTDEGRMVALDIIGIGRTLHPRNRLTNWGVFVGKNVGPDAIPLEKEIVEAKKMMEAKLLELFKEADDASRMGQKQFDEVISPQHIMAATYLNRLDVPWMKNTQPRANRKCPKCGTPAEADVLMCPTTNCGHIYDIERYVAYEAEQKRLLAAASK